MPVAEWEGTKLLGNKSSSTHQLITHFSKPATFGGGCPDFANLGVHCSVLQPLHRERNKMDEHVQCNFKKKLGSGGCADVHLWNYQGKVVAVKLFREVSHNTERRIKREIDVLSKLNHENVIGFLTTMYFNGQVAIIMDYAAGGTLHNYIRRKKTYANAAAHSIVHQMASGLAYLHDKGILHRDIKPANILFKDETHEHVLIADFGMADKRGYASYAGARLYRPPDEQYDRSSDVYSLALVACSVLAQKVLSNNSEDVDYITSKASSVLADDNIVFSGDEYDVLRSAYSRNKENRPTAREFRDAFESNERAPTSMFFESTDHGGVASASAEQDALSLPWWGNALLGAAAVGVGVLALVAIDDSRRRARD